MEAMKTILIPLKGKQPIEVSKLMRSLGLVDFKTKDDDPQAILSQSDKEIKPVEGLTGIPDFVDTMNVFEAKHWWADFDMNTYCWGFFRCKITEAGEQILKDNKVEYEYEIENDYHISESLDKIE